MRVRLARLPSLRGDHHVEAVTLIAHAVVAPAHGSPRLNVLVMRRPRDGTPRSPDQRANRSSLRSSGTRVPVVIGPSLRPYHHPFERGIPYGPSHPPGVDRTLSAAEMLPPFSS